MNEVRFPLDQAGGMAPVNGRAVRFLYKEGTLLLSGLTMEDVILLFQRKALTGPFDITLHGHSLSSAQLTLDRLAAPLAKPQGPPADELPPRAQSMVSPETAMQRFLRQLENEINQPDPLGPEPWAQLNTHLQEAANHFSAERFKELQAILVGRKAPDPLAPPEPKKKTRVNKAPDSGLVEPIISLPPIPALPVPPEPAPPEPVAQTEEPIVLTSEEGEIAAKLTAQSGLNLAGVVRLFLENSLSDVDRMVAVLRKIKPDHQAFKNKALLRDRIAAVLRNLQDQEGLI